jgi:alpha-N-arabinofuranosidase
MGDAIPQSSLAGVNPSARFFYSVTESRQDRVLHLKLVNATTLAQPLQLALQGAGAGAHVATVYSLHGATFEATNTLQDPVAIHPLQSTLHFTGATLKHTVPALTIEVIDLPLQ